jgi:zinc transporter ZupT
MLIFAGVYLFYWSEKVILLISDYRRMNKNREAYTIRKTSHSSDVSSSTTSFHSTPSENRDSSLFFDILDDGTRTDFHPMESRENTDPLYFSAVRFDREQEDTFLKNAISLDTKGLPGNLQGFDDCLSLTRVLPVTRREDDKLVVSTISSSSFKESEQDSHTLPRQTSGTFGHHYYQEVEDVFPRNDRISGMHFKDNKQASSPRVFPSKTGCLNCGEEYQVGTCVTEDSSASTDEVEDEAIERKNNLAWMVIVGDAIHNFIDGLSLGAALADSHLTGFSIAIAILFEEIPHELGDMSILLSSGMSRNRAAMFNFLSASSCYLGMMIGIISGDISSNSSNSYIFAVAAGMFLYISLFNIMTDLNENFKVCRSVSIWTACEMLFWQNLGVILGIYFLYSLAKFDESMLLSSLKIEL